MHKHEQQLADTLLHLPLPHFKDCTERRNKEDLVTSLCDRGVPEELITDASKGKSVIMQRSTQKTSVPTKDVTVTLGIR